MKEKFKKVLKNENVTPVEFSNRIGINYDSFRVLLSKDKLPRWVKAFMFGYSLKNVNNIEVTDPIHNCQKCGLEIHETIGIVCTDKNCPLL